MRIITAILALLITQLAMSEPQYSAHYGDINGDGYIDLIIIPDDNFVPVGVPTTPIMVMSDSPAYIIWGAGGNGTIQPISPRDYPRKALNPADIMFLDLEGFGILDAIVLFPGEEYNLMILKNFFNGAPPQLESITVYAGADRARPGDKISFEDINQNGALDLIVQKAGATGRHVYLREGQLYSKSPQIMAHGDSPGSSIYPVYMVGATPLDIDVINGDSYASIPFSIAPGPAGIQPSLSISYSSASDYGQAGMGFNLSGMSAISRCGRSFLSDGEVSAVSGSNDDLACLDGNRLVLVSGQYWQNGSRYRLESDEHVNIVFRRSNSFSSWFEVFQKDGDVYSYGNRDGSLAITGGHGAISRWALSYVEDRFGQGYKVLYKGNTAGLFPRKIQYTTSNGTGALASIEFEYEDDPYWKHAYIEGKKYDSGYRLKRISNIVSGEVYREYHFFYETSKHTERSLLSAILECSSHMRCLGSTTFGWNNSKLISLSEQTTNVELAALSHGEVFASVWTDVNGDGISDYCHIVHEEDTLLEAGCYIGSNGNALSSFVPIDISISGWNPFSREGAVTVQTSWNRDPQWVDVNDDGMADFCYSSALNQYTIRVICHVSSNDIPFSEIKTRDISLLDYFDWGIRFAATWVDVSGDGSHNLCIDAWYTSIWLICYDYLGHESFSFDSPRELLQLSAVGDNYLSNINHMAQGRWIDIDGDGVPDWCAIVGATVSCRINSNGQSLGDITWQSGIHNYPHPSAPAWPGEAGSGTSESNAVFIDFTGNGYNDYCRIVRTNMGGRDGYRASCLLSSGYGWTNEIHSDFIPSSPANATLFADINGNGWTDWCLERQGQLRCYMNKSGQFSLHTISINLGTTQTPTHASHTRTFTDILGNGMPSLCTTPTSHHDGANNHSIQCLSNSSSGTLDADDLAIAKNAFGLEYHFTYEDGSNPDVYQRTARTGPNGLHIYSGIGLRLVSSLKVSDGLGGYAESEYFYQDMGYHHGEFGGVGLAYMRARSDSGRHQQETWFLQNPSSHQAGLVASSRSSILLSGGNYTTVSESHNSWETHIYHGESNNIVEAQSAWNMSSNTALRYAVSLRESASLDYELDGATIREIISTNTYDEFGNLKTSEINTYGENQHFIQIINNSYLNDTADWIIGRLTRSESTRTGTYKGTTTPPQTRVSSWQHYSSGPAKGMVHKEILEPDAPQVRRETTYNYNSAGQVQSVTVSTPNAQPVTTTYYYDNLNRFIVGEENALGHQTTFQHHPVSGSLVSVTDPNGLATQWDYDAFDRTISETTPSGVTTYSSINLCSSFCPERAIYYTYTEAKSPLGETVSAPSYQFNDLSGRTLKESRAGFSGEIVSQLYDYDQQGNLYRYSEPHIEGEEVFWNIISSRDPSGRITEEILASGLSVQHLYNGLATDEIHSWPGNVLTASTEYDATGNLRYATDTSGRNITYNYDSYGQLIEVSLPDGENLVSEYDVLGRRIRHTEASTGVSRFSFDGHDRLILSENGNGERICQSYDKIGRLISRHDDFRPELAWEDAVVDALQGCIGQLADTLWSYDGAAGAGRLAHVSHSNFYEKSKAYDTLGRVSAVSISIDGEDYLTENFYDQDTGRIRVTKLPASNGSPGPTVEYRYNAHGYLSEIGPAGSPVYYQRIDALDARGSVTNTSLSNGAIHMSREIDPKTGLMRQIRAKRAVSSYWDIQSEAYSWDERGTMISRSENIVPQSRNILETFEYDNAQRLTSSTISNLSNPSLSYSESFEYDSKGNITYKSGIGSYVYGQECMLDGSLVTPAPYAVTQVNGDSASQFCYDAAGNMRTGGGRDIEYTVHGKPSIISSNSITTNFLYGANREIVKQEEHNLDSGRIVTTIRIGDYERVTVDHQDLQSTHERYSIGNAIIVIDDGDPSSAKESYIFTDALGSLSSVTDSFGQVTERHRYDAWGRPRDEANWLAISDELWEASNSNISATSTSRGFTGHHMIDAVRLVHMGGRLYDPSLARFTSPDPFVQDVTETASYNRYSYVVNSPMTFTDPSGYLRVKIKSGLGIGSSLRNEGRRLDRRVRNELSRFESRYRYEIRGIATLGIEPQLRYGGRELSRFAARNKFAGQIIGLAGVIGCSFATGGTGAPGCVAAFQGLTTGAMAYGSGAKFEHAFRSGARSAALAYANATTASAIGHSTSGIKSNLGRSLSKASLHGLRGGVFSSITGGDFKSGMYGASAEGLLGDMISGMPTGNLAAEIAIASVVSGAVSSAAGGNFWAGAYEGAIGFLFNQAYIRSRNHAEMMLREAQFASGVCTAECSMGFAAGELVSLGVTKSAQAGLARSSHLLSKISVKLASRTLSFYGHATTANSLLNMKACMNECISQRGEAFRW